MDDDSRYCPHCNMIVQPEVLEHEHFLFKDGQLTGSKKTATVTLAEQRALLASAELELFVTAPRLH